MSSRSGTGCPASEAIRRAIAAFLEEKGIKVTPARAAAPRKARKRCGRPIDASEHVRPDGGEPAPASYVATAWRGGTLRRDSPGRRTNARNRRSDLGLFPASR